MLAANAVKGKGRVQSYPQRMFDAVTDIAAIASIGGVTARLGQILSSFGYSAFLVTGVPEPPLRLEPYIMLNGWPRGWTELYTENDFYNVDPVAAWCRKTTKPFEWREATYDKESNPQAANVMNVARDFGMTEGFLVPIARPAGFQACVTMAGHQPDLDPMAKRSIHAISLFAHARISTLMGETVPTPGVLTPVEREILSWTAAGKSSWEIGQILNISKSSVDTLAHRASIKLDAVNRVQAVVNALRAGEIRF